MIIGSLLKVLSVLKGLGVEDFLQHWVNGDSRAP